MKSNTWTIIKKEFARFFGDRQLLFTTVIMPGLLIYIIYSLMGSGIQSMVTEGANEVVTMRVENMPASMAPVFSAMDSSLVVVEQPVTEADIAMLEDKELNAVLVSFPVRFEEAVAGMQVADSGVLPNVEIYYNSTNNAASRVYMAVSATLGNIGRTFTVNVPQSEGQRFDQASDESIGAMIWG